MKATMTVLVKEIEQMIGQDIKDTAIVQKALTHSSYANERKLSLSEHYERLEFLGDAVLELVVSEALLHKHGQMREGELSKCRSAVVNQRVLSSVAKQLSLGSYVRFGKGENKGQGAEKASILADVFESVCAAIYLSNGYEAARIFILKALEDKLGSADAKLKWLDSKSLLQEWTQRISKKVPEYRLVSSEGPDHSKTFFVEVWVAGKRISEGKGRSKKDAEQKAAQGALKFLKDEKTSKKEVSA